MFLTELTPCISTVKILTTLAGEFRFNWQVLLQCTVLLELKHIACMKSQACQVCQVFISLCSYDIFLGRDFLFKKLHMHLKIIQWIVWTYRFLCVLLIVFWMHLFMPYHVSDDIEVDSSASTISKSVYNPISFSDIVGDP